MEERLQCSAAVAFLEKAYDVMNKTLFENALQKPVITVQTRPKFFGYITLWQAWQDTVGGRLEINITAEWLNRPIVDVIATLVHEMVHQDNLMKGIKDVSRSGTYHNQKFRDTAEQHMLIIEKIPTHGWTKTTPSPWLCSFVKGQGWADLDMFRAMAPKVKKPSSTRKYICPECGQSVRATKTVNISCTDCEIPMKEAE